MIKTPNRWFEGISLFKAAICKADNLGIRNGSQTANFADLADSLSWLLNEPLNALSSHSNSVDTRFIHSHYDYVINSPILANSNHIDSLNGPNCISQDLINFEACFSYNSRVKQRYRID